MGKLHIEIRLETSILKNDINEVELLNQIKQIMPKFINNPYIFIPTDEQNNKLCIKVLRIFIECSNRLRGVKIDLTPECLEASNYYFYTANNYGEMAEEMTENENNDEEGQIGTFQWELPTADFEGLWENLIYEINDCPKQKLTNFISTSLKFAHFGVDPRILSRNHLILLNGPPGTGKTTLCKAVAQRMALRMQRMFKQTLFVEVNSHSLFSKWFSESGKLIQKLFSRIEELAERTDRLIFVLIDEVESLTIGRETAFAGNDPTDSVRAVNAMLTQLDRLKRFSNVFILCTSNIERALDAAFVDRIGLSLCFKSPKLEIINSILSICINEMKRVKGLFGDDQPESWTKEFENLIIRRTSSNCQTAKLSGRTIRKLPTIAYSMAAQHLDEDYYENNCTKIKFSQFLYCLYVESRRIIGKEAEKDDVKLILKEIEGFQEEENKKGSFFNFYKLKDCLLQQNGFDD